MHIASIPRRALAAALLAATGFTLASAGTMAAQPATAAHRLDEVYYLQPHNTYVHGTRLNAWLDAGWRTVELDVQDTEGWATDPHGPFVAHDAPGDHNCRGPLDRLADCLDDLVAWQDAHPGEPPLVVFVDMKSRVTGDFFSLWEPLEIVALDRFVSRHLGARLFRHADLRAHLAGMPGASLRAQLRERGWPTLGALRDRIVVAFTGGRIGDVNQRMAAAHALRGDEAGAFFCPDVDAAAPDEISGVVDSVSGLASGEVVCSNVKAGDHWQRVANRAAEWRQLLHVWGAAGRFSSLAFESAYIAVAHGATAVGLDVPTALDDPRVFVPDYAGPNGAIPFVGVRRSLPGYFALRLQGNGGACVGSRRDRTANGTALDAEACAEAADQQWVYTAEGQLRPRADNRACLDIAGGKAVAGRAIHLWDCDGGDSEKWRVTPGGQFRSVANAGDQCLAAPASGGQLRLEPCSDDALAQRFTLMPVPDWAQDRF